MIRPVLVVLSVLLPVTPVMARLDGLRDIHLPQELSWWPPAPGWWLLLALPLLTVWAWRWLRERTGIHRGRWDAARRELVNVRKSYHADGDARALVRDLSVWLRRAAVSLYGRRVAAGLTGKLWLEFLDAPMPVRSFVRGAGSVFAVMPYRNRGIVDAGVVLALCEQWLLAHQGSTAMKRHVDSWLARDVNAVTVGEARAL